MATQAPMREKPSMNHFLGGDLGSWAQSLPVQSQLLQAQEKAKSSAASMAGIEDGGGAHEQNIEVVACRVKILSLLIGARASRRSQL